MPSIVRGNPITLSAQFVDSDLAPVVPTSPLVDILDPDGVTVVNDAVPTATATVGLYEYVFTTSGSTDVGVWTIVWTGVIEGQSSESVGSFTVVSGGSILSPDCPDNPLWASPEDFALEHSTTILLATDAIAEATWVLWSLTGRRFHGIQCVQDIYKNRPGTCVIDLESWPVDEVLDAVKVINGVSSALEWSEIPGGSVRICCASGPCDSRLPCHSCRTCDDSVIQVNYRVKSNLPPGAVRVTNRLAKEFWKSANGAACSLPERITNVNRQGVSWTILDPLDFLEQGLTGLGPVDSWISSVNLRGAARLIDPLTRPPLLVSTITGCGAACS